ncbi:MAG TPA: transposase [Candidatus Eremiobacteraceae bacterium]|nr:transposase [Candidatus Eremiobacteraceae bacterium]
MPKWQFCDSGEAGKKVADICRKVGIIEGTYYAWKKQ